MWFTLILALSTLSTIYGHSSGASSSVCQARGSAIGKFTMRPGHINLNFVENDPKVTIDATVTGDRLNIVVKSAEKFRGNFE